MSIFGDNKGDMNQLYDDIDYFFERNGTLGEFYEVLEYYFRDKELKKEE